MGWIWIGIGNGDGFGVGDPPVKREHKRTGRKGEVIFSGVPAHPSAMRAPDAQ